MNRDLLRIAAMAEAIHRGLDQLTIERGGFKPDPAPQNPKKRAKVKAARKQNRRLK